jgi:hypothetical protein
MSGPMSEFKLISGIGRDVEAKLTELSHQGWKPILMSTTAVGVGDRGMLHITMVLELAPGAGK